ncbi:putative Clr5 domain protein [Rosellinia necatrix]|uniref:Putative Clr5 domain protein n=1 Tax=Rosellinia necatrix TaxID=77044 RepID=A0A1W2TVG3_ROSNE|nr:putative Clr5 domain protein [Rosellinia necatrix]
MCSLAGPEPAPHGVMMSEYIFVANNYVPPRRPSPSLVVTHRPPRCAVVPSSMPTPPLTLSPRSTQSPPAQTPPDEPTIVRSHEAEPAKPTPTQMQSVFSSQTGEAYRSQQHTAQVWESHKADIRRLYLDENRPLKEVMAIMRQKGFRATVRMYKSRFDKWGFSKNNSKREVVTMLQVQRQRNALGKRTTFQRNGREIAIDAYLKRKGISQYDLAEPGIAESLPEHLRCVTPPPETPLIIQAGGSLSLQELVLQTARDLAWTPYCAPDLPLVTNAVIYRADDLRCAITDITNADWLFHVGRIDRGGVMVEQGFKSLHLMVTRPSIYGLLHLLLFHLDAYNKGIIKEVWRYLAAYSATIRSDGPLARLFQGISKFINTHEFDEYWNLIFECTERLLLIDEQNAGLPEGTIARLYPLVFIPRAHQYKQGPYRRLQNRCDWNRLTQGTKPRVAEEMVFYEASELLIVGTQSNWKSKRIVELAHSVLEKTKDFAYNVDFFIYVAYNALAHYHRADFKPGDSSNSPKHQLSIYYLEKVCELSEGKWDADLGYFMGDLEKLEDWYREAGDTAKADEAHERWRNSLEMIPMGWERAPPSVV